MSISSKFHHIRRLLVAALVLPLFGACSYIYDDGGDCDDMITPQIATANHYINLKIVVSSGKENATRADGENGEANTTTTTPAGGEDGDGRETGSTRENEVTGITLMLYEAESNASAESNVNIENNSTLAFVRYYPVKLVEPRKNGGQEIGDGEYEAVYTTGNQSLADSELDLTKTYRAIVVANRNMEPAFKKGDDVKVIDVCDYLVSAIYTGTGLGVDAKNFVMSSVKNNLIKFSDPEETTVNGKTTQVYSFNNIYIQRLAARVDFWTNNATYYDAAETDNTPGYEYSVEKNNGEPSNDKFVLTAVTPFNLYNGEEYPIKRIEIKEGENTAIQYFGEETTSSYVIDPKTAYKTIPTTGKSPTNYRNPLATLVEFDKKNKNENKNETLLDATETGFYQSTRSLYDNKSTSNSQLARFTSSDGGDKGYDNYILCYPIENTLLKESPLYYYATGVAIEGDYYEDDWETAQLIDGVNPKVKHLIYYGYLRHQGEGAAAGYYNILPAEELDDKETGKDTPMNFGVVRNNIYRISIDRITEKRDIQLRIVVKKWDTFTHDVIYM